jgi:Domain of unknown function (DUF3598)
LSNDKNMTSQWQGLLQNLGTWQGSFTQLSPEGVQIEDTSSELTLSLSADEKTVDLLLKRDSCRDIALQFQYPGPGPQIPFFESGCFSQGSLQWSPYSSFGAEFALIHGDRHLRLVQLYNSGTDPSSLTLVRESRADSGATESPPLQVSDLLGTWEGDAIALYSDARRSEPYQTHLQVEQVGDRLTQTLQFGTHTIQSSAGIDGNLLHFEESSQHLRRKWGG